LRPATETVVAVAHAHGVHDVVMVEHAARLDLRRDFAQGASRMPVFKKFADGSLFVSQSSTHNRYSIG
jgi:hypothetical protein